MNNNINGRLRRIERLLKNRPKRQDITIETMIRLDKVWGSGHRQSPDDYSQHEIDNFWSDVDNTLDSMWGDD